MGSDNSLATTLREATVEGSLYVSEGDGVIRCLACAHGCRIREGGSGACLVRYVQDGVLRVPHGYVAGLQVDPIEKKPFYHVLPGQEALSFGMLGCNFHCEFCQNWISSQTLRDPRAGARPEAVKAEEIVALALRHGAPVIASTYNEPVITSEWAVRILESAKPHGIRGAFVSNGYATEENLRFIKPYVPFMNIDLKSFREEIYRHLGGSLSAVQNTIRLAHKMGFWIEVVTLIVPGMNDSPEELGKMAEFIVSVSPDIPWHLTAYHRAYRATGAAGTSKEAVLGAAEIGMESGVRYVYAGNLGGAGARFEDTHCHACGSLLVRRRGFGCSEVNVTADGHCPECQATIPGVWQ